MDVNVLQYFEDLVADYNRINVRYFNGDQQIIEESAIKLENHCEMLATFLRYTHEEHFQSLFTTLYNMVSNLLLQLNDSLDGQFKTSVWWVPLGTICNIFTFIGKQSE